MVYPQSDVNNNDLQHEYLLKNTGLHQIQKTTIGSTFGFTKNLTILLTRVISLEKVLVSTKLKELISIFT